MLILVSQIGQSTYIYKVLKQVHPDTGISNRAIKCTHPTVTRSSCRSTWILVSWTGQSNALILHSQGPQAGPSQYWDLKQSHQIYSSHIYKVLKQLHHDTGILNWVIKCTHPAFMRSSSRSIPILVSQTEPSDILILHLQGPQAGPPWYWYLEQGTQMYLSYI